MYTYVFTYAHINWIGLSNSFWHLIYIAHTTDRIYHISEAYFININELITAWISNHMPSATCDEIASHFLNFNSATVEVWQKISNFIPHPTSHVITYYWDLI